MFPSSGLVIDLLKPNTFVHCYIPSVGFTAVISGRTVTGDCQGEMLDYRRMLMEDFSLSPEDRVHIVEERSRRTAPDCTARDEPCTAS